MGPKTEKRTSGPLSTEVPGLIPTEQDAVIDTQDGQILQYVYSSSFENVLWGMSLTRLFKKFSETFGRSIVKPSLRQAILAWGATYTPLPDQSGYARMHEYSNQAVRAIRTKVPATLEEADLFATFLLALLSSVYYDLTMFKKHLCDFIAIAREIRQRPDENKYRVHLSTFWPLARDMILESFRRFPEPSSMVISFSRQCHGIIGTQSLIRRAVYLWDFFGYDPSKEYAFSQTVWTYSRLLRVCFRATVYRQLEPETYMEPLIKSTVRELKADLWSPDVSEIVSSILSLKPALSSHEHSSFVDSRMDLLRFSILVYRFCELLISLLEARTILEGTRDDKCIKIALEIKDLVEPEWLRLVNWSRQMLCPRAVADWLTPRILWTAGLCLGGREYLQGEGLFIELLLIRRCK